MFVFSGRLTSTLSHEQTALSKTLFNLLTPRAEGVGWRVGGEEIHKAKGVFSIH